MEKVQKNIPTSIFQLMIFSILLQFSINDTVYDMLWFWCDWWDCWWAPTTTSTKHIIKSTQNTTCIIQMQIMLANYIFPDDLSHQTVEWICLKMPNTQILFKDLMWYVSPELSKMMVRNAFFGWKKRIFTLTPLFIRYCKSKEKHPNSTPDVVSVTFHCLIAKISRTNCSQVMFGCLVVRLFVCSFVCIQLVCRMVEAT